MPKYGIVVATRLNLRDGASTSAQVTAKLSKNTVVEILKQIDEEWAQVRVDDSRIEGFVASDFLRLTDTHPDKPQEAAQSKRVEITTRSLRVRSGPGTIHSIVGRVSQGEVLEVEAEMGDWLKVKFSGGSGYVATQFTKVTSAKASSGFLIEDPDLMEAELIPDHIIPEQEPKTRKAAAARVWNSYGGLLDELADRLDIDVASMVAVIGAESSGKAYGEDGRLFIRFENHLFYRFWGADNPDIFRRHFAFDESAVRNNWKGHKFRVSEGHEFRAFHGSQQREWDVLEFARGLDDTAALRAISMGAPQVMGFNYRSLGYESVQQMFNNFSRSAHAQVLALFDFVKGAGSTSPAIQALQNRDYLGFATIYNGPGNAPTYSRIISNYVSIYNDLIKTATIHQPADHSRGPEDITVIDEPEVEAAPAPEVPEEAEDTTESGEEPQKTYNAKSKTSRLRVRDAAGTRSNIIEHLNNGEVVILLEDHVEAYKKMQQSSHAGQFLHIRTDEDREGYVAAWLMEPEYTLVEEKPDEPAPEVTPELTTEEQPEPEPQPFMPEVRVVPTTESQTVGIATTNSLRVRKSANTKSAVVDRLKRNEAATLLDPVDEAVARMKTPASAGNFLHIRTERGNEGYVAAWFMAPSTYLTQLGVNKHIDNIPDYELPAGYHELWKNQEKLGLPDPFDVLPVQIRTTHELTEMQVNGFGPNTFSSRNWRKWYSRIGGMHNGYDFIVKLGTPLLAVSDGVIIKHWVFMGNRLEKTLVLWCFLPERYKDERGRRMMSNVLVAYGHMADISIRKNHEIVRAGDVIGLGGRPVGSTANDHLHYEVHLLVGDTDLPNPRYPRRLLSEYKKEQPLDNNTPWNPLLFYSQRMINYQLYQGQTIGYLKVLPEYPTKAMLRNQGVHHLPEMTPFTLAYYRYGIRPIWNPPGGGKTWPEGVVTTDMLSDRIATFEPFEPYPPDFLD